MFTLDTKVRARGCVHRTPTERNERAQVWGSCKGMRAAQGNVQMHREAAVTARVRKIPTPPTPRGEFNTAVYPGKPVRDITQSAALPKPRVVQQISYRYCSISISILIFLQKRATAPPSILTPCFDMTGTELSPQPLWQGERGSRTAAPTGHAQAWTRAGQRAQEPVPVQARKDHCQVVREKTSQPGTSATSPDPMLS